MVFFYPFYGIFVLKIWQNPYILLFMNKIASQFINIIILILVALFFSMDKFITSRTSYISALSDTGIFLDQQGTRTCDSLSSTDFTPQNFPWYPGLYTGKVWINATIDNSKLNIDEAYTVNLGNDYIAEATIYILSDGTWVKTGRTGRGLKKSEINIASKDPVLPLKSYYIKHNPKVNIRICISCESGNPIKLGIMEFPKFMEMEARNHAIGAFNCGGGFLIIIAVLFIAIGLKNNSFFLLFLSSALYFIKEIQLSGTGPVILWNQFSGPILTPMIFYVLDIVSSMLFFYTIYSHLKDNGLSDTFRKFIFPINQIFIVTFLVILVCKNPTIRHCAYLISTALIFNTSFAGLYATMYKHRDARTLTYFCWTFIVFFGIILRTINFLKITFPSPAFSFLTSDKKLIPEFTLLMMTVPSLLKYATNMNSIFLRLKSDNRILTKENEELKERIVVDTSTVDQIVKLSRTILTTSDILYSKTYIRENCEYIDIIKRKTSKAGDIATILKERIDTEHRDKNLILLESFFTSCLQSSKKYSEEKNCNLSVKNAITNDTLVLANEKILQYIFIDFSIAIIEFSKEKTKPQIQFEQENDTFILESTITLNSAYSSSRNQKDEFDLSEDPRFNMINLAANLYEGTISSRTSGTKCTITIKFNLECIPQEKALGRKIVTKSILKSIPFSGKLEPLGNERQDADTEQQAEDFDSTLETMKEENKEGILDRYGLSKREKQITSLIIAGKSDKEIAEELGISTGTVASHNKNLFKKIGIHSRVELMTKLR